MEEFLKSAGYGAVFGLSFISAMGLPVGAEIALIFGGALASGKIPNEGKPLSLALVIILATLGEVLGSAAGYGIGRYGGRTLVDKVGKYVLLTHKDLDRADAWFARRGEPVVFFGRSSPCCGPSCPSRLASGRWRSASSSCTPSSRAPSGAPPSARLATASGARTTTC
jgi:membrane protein DedA with SNARE-associated domain